MNGKRIYKIRNGVLWGVCGGIGEYLNIDPVVLRIIWALLGFTGFGIVAYVVAALLMPYQDEIR